jgi:hypothetical protein
MFYPVGCGYTQSWYTAMNLIMRACFPILIAAGLASLLSETTIAVPLAQRSGDREPVQNESNQTEDISFEDWIDRCRMLLQRQQYREALNLCDRAIDLHLKTPSPQLRMLFNKTLQHSLHGTTRD